ncbi:MAG: SusD/RagB family nutrient-binding outer membrane lipoprotein [Bacteroidales bacterium]|jgi:hypothetical protein|nr:SusD/RagB family nutrient-binding outer membrane lipoprotein [Bacteroidales bacterium]
MNTIKKLFFALLALPVLLTGCDKEFDDINKSPNSTTSVPTPYIMTYAQRELGFYLYDVWRSGRQSSIACQHLAQRNYTSEDRYLFRQEVTDGFFRNTYFITQSFQDIINLNTNEATKGGMAAYGDNSVQIATAKLMQIWAVELLAETFGDVPYTQAWQAPDIVMPAYDKQSDLFPKLLADAKTAVDALKAGNKGWSNGDVLFGGDLDKWISFGNSLRLRIALRMSNVNAAWKTTAKAIIAEGVMSSNDDNAIIQFTGPGAPNEAPFYNGFIVGKRNDFTLTKQFVGLLAGVNDTDKGYTNPFEGLEDPRFRVYIGESNYSTGRKTGVPYGMLDAATGGFVNANGTTVINLTRQPLPLLLQANFWSTFLDYPTVCFMKSEVNDFDKVNLEEGIRASLEMWGAEVDEDYIDEVLARYDAANAEGKKEIVLTQKYIHLFAQSFEAWAEYRRTGYPKSIVKPGEVTYNGVKFVTANDTGTDIVPRLKYDTNEYTLNADNVKAAATSIGGDAYNTKLWWAKK